MQLLFGPAYYVNHGLNPRKEHCFGFGPTLITPESRGSISLKSDNPLLAPAIRANYLSTDADMRVILEGVKLSGALLTQSRSQISAVASFIRDQMFKAMTRSSNSSEPKLRLFTILSARAKWDMMPWLSLMIAFESTALMDCEWLMHP